MINGFCETNVMLDLETIGNDYDGIFTAIGACEFCPEIGAIGRKFHTHVSWESSVAAGRTITPDTIKWWMTQSEEARKDIMQKGLNIECALLDFAKWLSGCEGEPVVWGNGPTFDIGKLETAYGYYDLPWHFSMIRCVRTIRDISRGIVDRDSIPFEGEKHNALDDAVHQSKYVSAMYQALRNNKKEK